MLQFYVYKPLAKVMLSEAKCSLIHERTDPDPDPNPKGNYL